jgi:hypothetical protein
MAEFQGEKFIQVDGGDYYSAEYATWLEERVAELNCQLDSCRKNNSSLRRQLEASHRDEARRFRQQQDYVPYGDDDYDR